MHHLLIRVIILLSRLAIGVLAVSVAIIIGAIINKKLFLMLEWVHKVLALSAGQKVHVLSIVAVLAKIYHFEISSFFLFLYIGDASLLLK